MQRVSVASGNISSDTLSFALLSLISTDDQNIHFSSVNKSVINKLYEALCTSHVANLSKTILSLNVTGTSEKFPYHCNVLRGVWNCSDNIDSYSDGGSTINTFFNKNPMYKLKINSSKSNKISVSITLLQENKSNKTSDNYTKDNFCYVAIYSKKDIAENLTNTNSQDEGLLTNQLIDIWNSGQRFIFNFLVDGTTFRSLKNDELSQSVGTKELDSDEEYIIVPYKNVNIT